MENAGKLFIISTFASKEVSDSPSPSLHIIRASGLEQTCFLIGGSSAKTTKSEEKEECSPSDLLELRVMPSKKDGDTDAHTSG